MLQDIEPKCLHNEYKPQEPSADAYAVIVEKGKILAKVTDGTLTLPRFSELDGDAMKDARYLIRVDEDRFFLPKAAADAYTENLTQRGYVFLTRADLRYLLPEWMRFAAITSLSLAGWYESNRFCGHCGTHLVHSDKERMMQCPSCGQMHFPKICPAVIVGITNGDKILLTKYNPSRNNKRYALVAGFTEIGETIEQTVHREVMEETGLKVKNLRYYKCQPWPLTDTLLFGFFCEVDGSDEIHMDTEELSVAEWVAGKDLNIGSGEISLTYEMIKVFSENCKAGIIPGADEE